MMHNGSLFMTYAFPFTLIAAIVEALYLSRKHGRNHYDWRAFLSSGLIAAGRVCISAIPFGLVGVIFRFVFAHRIYSIELGAWWQLALFLALHEFLYYWFHRLGHEIRWFWASHRVHHSPRQMNLSVAYRLSWTDKLSLNALVFMPMVWLGFDPDVVLIMLAINSIWQFWFHTELVPKLGWFEYILNTPSHHRVHHACNVEYLDKNYGGILIVFDRLFGTFAEENANVKIHYGLLEKANDSYNPAVIAFSEWFMIYRDVKTSRNIRHMLKYLFGEPGWQPDEKGPTTRNLRAGQAQLAQRGADCDRQIDYVATVAEIKP